MRQVNLTAEEYEHFERTGEWPAGMEWQASPLYPTSPEREWLRRKEKRRAAHDRG